jgi:SAM-dependent methyltransferase
VLPGEYKKIFSEEEAYWWYVGRRSILNRILASYVLSKVPFAVDIGCGTGINFRLLRNYAQRFSGADTSAAALAFCRRRGFNNVARLVAVDDQLPYPTSSAALVTLLDTLEHAADDQRLLKEIRRILTPGGLLVMTVPAYQFLWSEHDEALGHYRRYTRAALVRQLEQTGFTVRKASYCITAVFPLIVAYRVVKGLMNQIYPSTPRTSHVRVPPFLNRLFITVLKIEGMVLKYTNLPYGTSVIIVASKHA